MRITLYMSEIMEGIFCTRGTVCKKYPLFTLTVRG